MGCMGCIFDGKKKDATFLLGFCSRRSGKCNARGRRKGFSYEEGRMAAYDGSHIFWAEGRNDM
jgi:hypothetical protein